MNKQTKLKCKYSGKWITNPTILVMSQCYLGDRMNGTESLFFFN